MFDVRAFGATGNGSSADGDTRAFRAAWKAACSAESATVLVPSDGVFTITSTIFAGPCKPGLTFQVKIYIITNTRLVPDFHQLPSPLINP